MEHKNFHIKTMSQYSISVQVLWTRSQDSVHKLQLLRKKMSRSGREPGSVCLPNSHVLVTYRPLRPSRQKQPAKIISGYTLARLLSKEMISDISGPKGRHQKMFAIEKPGARHHRRARDVETSQKSPRRRHVTEEPERHRHFIEEPRLYRRG